MTQLRMSQGAQGEKLAAEFLIRQGYTVLARNWRCSPTGTQIDLVASLRQRADLVEVKYHRWVGSGFEKLIDPAQRRRLLRSAAALQRVHFSEKEWGFMLVWIPVGGVPVVLEREDLGRVK